MTEIPDVTTNLTHTGDGVWVARNQSDVSYPREGHELCFEVEDSSFWFSHRNDVITALVRAFSPDGALFDIGGGNGYVAMALQRAGIETFLVEPGSGGARNAKARGVNIVIQSTLEDVGFKPGSVAAFGLFDVLEHIEDDAAFLLRLHGYLQPEGYLYLTVPAFNFLWSVDDAYAGHYRRYTALSLTEKVKSAGFALRYCSYFFGPLVPAIFLFRSIPSRLGIRRSITTEGQVREHSRREGIIGSALQSCLALEVKRMEKGSRVPVGSSLVAVLQKAVQPRGAG